jgi:hypothetical protein
MPAAPVCRDLGQKSSEKILIVTGWATRAEQNRGILPGARPRSPQRGRRMTMPTKLSSAQAETYVRDGYRAAYAEPVALEGR